MDRPTTGERRGAAPDQETSAPPLDTARIGNGRSSGLVERARQHVAAGDSTAARASLRALAMSDRSYRAWLAGSRLLRSLQETDTGPAAAPLRVALLGTSTLDQVGDLLALAGLVADLVFDVYTAGYGQYETEVLDPGSRLHAFQPDVVVLAPDASAVDFPLLADDPAAEVDREVDRWTSVWTELQHRLPAHVLQVNFVPPHTRPLGSLEEGLPGSRRRCFDELNARLAQRATEARVAIVDASAVAQGFGLSHWRDDRYWFHARQPLSLAAVPHLVVEIAAVIQARLGRARKVLVTDLDNTLWGGVVGEDGVAGLQLSGSPVGEAHLALQAHMLDLKARGILLAVSSKNDDAAARAPFLEREDMLLSLDDFAGFVTNWSPKDEGLQSLAEQLGLGLDASCSWTTTPRSARSSVRGLRRSTCWSCLRTSPATCACSRSTEGSSRPPSQQRTAPVPTSTGLVLLPYSSNSRRPVSTTTSSGWRWWRTSGRSTQTRCPGQPSSWGRPTSGTSPRVGTHQRPFSVSPTTRRPSPSPCD